MRAWIEELPKIQGKKGGARRWETDPKTEAMRKARESFKNWRHPTAPVDPKRPRTKAAWAEKAAKEFDLSYEVLYKTKSVIWAKELDAERSTNPA